MKKLLSVNYSDGAFNFSMLLIRLCFGILIILKHGMPHLMDFSAVQDKFYNFLGIGSKLSLILVIFAEIFCGLFVVLGLFTRLAVIPLIIVMLVIIFGAHAGKPMIQSEIELLYFGAWFLLLLCGPGKLSVDNMMH